MPYEIDITKTERVPVSRLSDKFFGKDPDGRELGFTNDSMILDGKPFYAISGECHYSRVPEGRWEDTILKMKAGGINIISTYVFWNVHEEFEGKFRFDGRRNLRGFIELAKKHGIYVILRIGPFNHGEMRNGGLPDWLYGKPFEVRSCDAGFMQCARRLYRAISEQIQGLLYKDGGPIIGTQIDNEYMHSAAPWEMTTGAANEWLPSGNDGEAYMKQLKEIAVDEGIITPFYTCTGWGGAITPVDEMLPLWGGYAFWPWMFYGDKEYKHPATPEYIYRYNHNNKYPSTYNFEPRYEPESVPYACCEMGGGMSNYYNYRFQFPYKAVDAMANVKLGSGCNFLGYYMFRGGSNPVGEKTFLNECQCPKISYDYQAAIGEFGQLRPSYYRLKSLHQFVKNFEDRITGTFTVLPDNSEAYDPNDTRTLRYAVRTDGRSGFLFLNNYQDHAECHDKKDEAVTIHLDDEDIRIDGISLDAEESAVLPFNMELGKGITIKYATVQPLSVIRKEDRIIYLFFVPQGMKPRYVFSDGKDMEPETGAGCGFCLTAGDGTVVEIITLSDAERMDYYEFETSQDGIKKAVLSDKPVTFDGNSYHLEVTGDEETGVDLTRTGASRYTFNVPDLPEDAKEVMLRIDYRGDVGQIFDASGTLIEDNFSNEATWEIGLKSLDVKPGEILTLYITPRKENVTIDVSSVMAGRAEKAESTVAELTKVSCIKIYDKVIPENAFEGVTI
ncbi:MAG: beta-galactosidase [Lachnospiraceae bacterium]|nr:beta-galactosidase [Lachnospiraceae bacterium]